MGWGTRYREGLSVVSTIELRGRALDDAPEVFVWGVCMSMWQTLHMGMSSSEGLETC